MRYLTLSESLILTNNIMVANFLRRSASGNINLKERKGMIERAKMLENQYKDTVVKLKGQKGVFII